MKADCRTFRDQLAAHLRGLRADASLTELSWHEHLLACQDCRDLLDAEEALEILLDSLPEPRLPAHLAERVLARLEDARESLDRLLELSTVEAAPPDLGARIAAGIGRKRIARDLELDRLLDRVGSPKLPERLAQDTLAALAGRRERVPPPVVRGPNARWAPLALAAAALALIVTLWLRGGERPEPVATLPEPIPPAPSIERRTPDPALDAGVEEDLLASLDVLENWELLTDEELDVLLSSLDPWDEVLLELEAEAREASSQEPENG
jgi:hypothetical protein